MKKFLSLFIVSMTSIASFSSVRPGPWDAPLFKPMVALHAPGIFWCTITIIDDYHIVVRTAVDQADPVNTWRSKLKIEAEWYVPVGGFPPTWAWQSVTYLYDIDIPPTEWVYDTYITLPRRSRFLSMDDGYTVFESEYDAYDFFCLGCS